MAADVHCPATAAQGVRVTVGVASYNRPELLRGTKDVLNEFA